MPWDHQSDGTFRDWHKPKLYTMKSRMARWLEAEAFRLKVMGMTYPEIATHVIDVAHGKQRPIVPLPEGASFKPRYKISVPGVALAYRRALARIPQAEIEEFRKLQTERCEAMILALQGGISKGNPRAIEVGVHVLAHQAKLNNLAPAKLDVKVEEVPFTVFQIQQYIANRRKADEEEQKAIDVENEEVKE